MHLSDKVVGIRYEPEGVSVQTLCCTVVAIA